MKLKRILWMLLLAAVGSAAFSQTSDQQLKSILLKFKNYRYGNISLFKVEGQAMTDLVQLLADQPKITDERYKGAENYVKTSSGNASDIESKVLELGSSADLPTLMSDPDVGKKIKGSEAIAYAKYLIAMEQFKVNVFQSAYIVTSRLGEFPMPKVYALITSPKSRKEVKKNLDVPKEVYTTEELRISRAPAGSPAKSLQEYLYNYVIQQQASEGINVTAEAQGLGDETFIQKVYGLSLIVNEDDVATYKRISEGQAMNYFKPNELVLSPDLISYRYYEPSEATPLGSDSIYNRLLTKYGVELRYGLDPVNMPSFFSDRVILDAVWGVNKLGVVLPTNGWSSLGKQFGMTQRMTHAGFGLDAAFDFPLKISNSGTGVFNIAANYVFNDAVKSDHQTFERAEQPITNMFVKGSDTVTSTRTTSLMRDYLIRFSGQVHYTFAISIDSGNYFRFRIGAGLYSREIWTSEKGMQRDIASRLGKQILDTTYKVDSFTKTTAKAIGGVSARIDYMASAVSTPYGFGLQYFDEAMLMNAWLLVPLSSDLGIRFEGSMAAPVLRDPYEWENKSTFVPSARLIYNF